MTSITVNRVPFGLRDGVMVEVSEVDSGLACSCICPACERPLQARKGKIRSHHFAHDSSAGEKICTAGLETSIHLMAKQILKDDVSLVLPELTIKQTAEDAFGRAYTEEMSVEEAGIKSFERVELEKRLEDIRPDIIAYIDGSPLLIEVAVTSFVGKEKKQRIQKLRLPAVEIDLGSVSYATTKEDLRNLLNSESTKKVWLSNPKAIGAKSVLKSRLEDKIHRINEANPRRTLQSPDYHSTPTRRPPSADSSLSRRQIHAAEGHGETRWFHCESCTDVFELPLSAAPPSIRTVTCPGCRCLVSAARHRTII